ncbi:MAG TPA: hypothetical protein ENI64_12220 [Gammaproteobacteria bacterium]|nr:hypothetical protein [Gammaproteobacteria bacterium]
MHKTKGILLLLLLLSALPVQAVTLQEVQHMAVIGAPTLALKLLERDQPPAGQDINIWMDWEHQRIDLASRLRRWQVIDQRLSILPPEADDAFRLWATARRGKALLEQGKPEQALVAARQSLWVISGQAESASMPLRLLIIRAYLNMGKLTDAETAMIRFRQDYPQIDINSLQAEILLRVGRYDDAAELFKQYKGGDQRALRFLAQLESGQEQPAALGKRILWVLRKSKLTDTDTMRLWQLVARSAETSGLYVRRINALHKAMMTASQIKKANDSGLDALFPIRGTDLWDAYLDYGQFVANRQQLLTGQDEQWAAAAGNVMENKPLQAAALWAVLAQNSIQANNQLQAHAHFSELLMKQKQGAVALRYIYLKKDSPLTATSLPEHIKHQLADAALAWGDLALASRLMGQLTTAPEGKEGLDWYMRRARILLLGGQVDEGIQALHDLLDQYRVMPRLSLDRLMQVLFDLQALERHQDAIALFKKLPVPVTDMQLQREVAYWIAESYSKQKDYTSAAAMYLQSATLPGPNTMDPWAETARYHAADNMAKAGLVNDARYIYRQLLKITKDESRRTVIRNRMQQLLLTSQRKGSDHE